MFSSALKLAEDPGLYFISHIHNRSGCGNWLLRVRTVLFGSSLIIFCDDASKSKELDLIFQCGNELRGAARQKERVYSESFT